MIALNIVLMLAVMVGIVSLLAWAIVSDRKRHRSAVGETSPAEAPLHNRTMPRGHRDRPRAPQSRRRVPRSSPA